LADDAFRRIDAVLAVSLRLVRTAPSGKVLLARIASAIDVEWIPRPDGEAIASELQIALDTAGAPIPWRQVERTLRDAWGRRAAAELDELDPEPVAVRPGSQVHRGVLEGAAVAIKVQRPGLARSVRQDLALLEAVIAPLAAAFPALDASALVAEFRERVLDELDLEHEAVTQRRFHRALRDHPLLAVPAPVMRLSHERVLVSEWVDGVPLRRAPDPERACALLVLFVLGAARGGLIDADADPDDILALPDGRLAILDFGATRVLDPERVAVATAALEAFLDGDAGRFGATLERLGWLPASRAGAALELAREALGELAGPDPSRLDGDAVLAARDRLWRRRDQLADVIAAGALAPEDLWPARAVGQLFATIARVGATGTWSVLARTAVREGWSAPITGAAAGW